jgi:hypothetical protein
VDIEEVEREKRKKLLPEEIRGEEFLSFYVKGSMDRIGYNDDKVQKFESWCTAFITLQLCVACHVYS